MASVDAKALELFRQLPVADLPAGLYLIAKDGRFLTCNSLCKKILMVPADGPLPATIMDFHPKPEQRIRLLREAEAAGRLGRLFTSGPLHLCVTGNDIFVREFIRALRDPDSDEVVGFVGTMIDITQEQRFRQLIDVLPIGIYRVDENDRITHVNQAAVNSRTVKNRNGKIIGRTGVVRDITIEKKLREDMRHLQSDIGRVLHSYTATLLMVKHTLSATVASLGPEPYAAEESPSMEEIESAIAEPAKRLAKALGNFLHNEGEKR
jgi:PAS domain-containing protein